MLAYRVLRPFTSAYLCESWFSTLLHIKTKARNRLNVEDEMRLALEKFVFQSTLEFFPIDCPNGRLGQDLGFGGFAFALKLPELLNTNLAAVRAKLGQTSCFPNGPQIWCPIGQ